MKYDHMFCIAFSVVSDHPEGLDVTAEQIRDAIFSRVQSAYASGELREAADAPMDSYEIEGAE